MLAKLILLGFFIAFHVFSYLVLSSLQKRLTKAGLVKLFRRLLQMSMRLARSLLRL